MAPCLEGLSPELVEEIVGYVGWLSSICSLRLTCRALALNCAQGAFKTYFRSKTVLLTPTGLAALVQGTKPGTLGTLLEELTIVGITPLPGIISDELRSGNEEAESALLSRAFSRLKKSGKDKRLRKISMKVAIAGPPTGKASIDVWNTASYCFRIVLSALAVGRLQVAELDVFTTVPSCSLANGELLNLDLPMLKQTLQGLRTLSLSLSDDLPIGKLTDVVRDSLDDRASQRIEKLGAASALSDFLNACSNLEKLDLCYSTIRQGMRQPVRQDGILWSSIAETVALPELHVFQLRGFGVAADELLAFLRRHAIRELETECVSVTSPNDGFRPIFSYCTSEDNQIRRLYLNYLLEVRGNACGLLHFDEPVTGFEELSLRRDKEEMRHPIQYEVPDGPFGSPELSQLRIRMKQEYGPYTLRP